MASSASKERLKRSSGSADAAQCKIVDVEAVWGDIVIARRVYDGGNGLFCRRLGVGGGGGEGCSVMLMV